MWPKSKIDSETSHTSTRSFLVRLQLPLPAALEFFLLCCLRSHSVALHSLLCVSDILHDYQAKRTIDEVYQRVQKLFKGQPDLLDEFKYFLPESAVGQPKAWPPSQKSGSAKPTTAQAGAKTAAGAPKAVMGKPVQAKPAGTGAVQRDAQGRVIPVAAKASVSAKPGSAVPGSKEVARPVQRDAKGNIIPPKKPVVAAPVVASSSGHHGSSHKKHDGHREHRHHRDRESRLPAITYPPSCDKELTLFERMKQASSKAQWVQFLKALNLFAHDIISRSELLRMVEDVYGEKGTGMGVGSDWVDKFKQSIGYDEAEEKQVASLNQTNYYSFVSSVDFTICHQVTPSYRELPPQILVPHSSGRNELADEVLNDTCISIPTGSEDFSFKSTRKNIYEENLFKIEDERFELDMLIENNSAAIRVLEPLNDQIAIMPPEAAKRVRLPDTIDILHIRSIARVYGDQGYEMVELLNKSPAVAVNIILMRLKQKDVEWRKTRNEMKSTWRKVNEANYQRSLDHRSFYFKQEDKKRRSAKALVTELKEVQHAVFGSSGVQPPKASPPASATRSQAEQKDANGEVIKRPLPTPTQEDLTGDESLMLRAIKQGQKPNTLLTYCMVFKYGDAAIHQQLFDLMARVSALRSNDTDQLKALLFFQGFVSHFFGVTLKDEQNARIQALTEKVAIDEAKRKEGLSAEEAAAALELPSEREKAASESLGMDLGSEDEEEKAEEPEVAPAAAAAAATADSRKLKGKKKTTKAKKTKKKPGSVAGKMIGGLNPASAAAAAAAIAKEKEDEELDDALDEDDDEKRGGGFSKNAKDEAADGDDAGAAGDVSQSRLRSAAAAALAASQLSKVQGLLKKLSAAAEITDNAANFPRGIPPVGLYLDTPWLQKEAAASSAPSSAAAAAAASSSSSAAAPSAKPSCPTLRDHGKSSKLFLGSHPYYVFFRLHQFLYERLHTAKQLAHKARRNSSKKKLPATPEERHTRFCVILDQLLSGELETTRFEDECRNLLGASSYVLFTIDKLIEQLVKQTVNLLSSDNSLKVLSLYQYEQRRVRTCMAQFKKNNVNAEQQKMQLSQLARQYQSNIANLLGDDSACAIEYVSCSKDTRSAFVVWCCVARCSFMLCRACYCVCVCVQFDESHDLAMGLIEHLDETNKHSPGEEWNQFVFEYLADCPQVMLRTPFRKRSVRFATRALVRMMTQGASAKEKTRIQKEAQDTSNQELMAAALKFVYQKKSDEQTHRRLRVVCLSMLVHFSPTLPLCVCCVCSAPSHPSSICVRSSSTSWSIPRTCSFVARAIVAWHATMPRRLPLASRDRRRWLRDSRDGSQTASASCLQRSPTVRSWTISSTRLCSVSRATKTRRMPPRRTPRSKRRWTTRRSSHRRCSQRRTRERRRKERTMPWKMRRTKCDTSNIL